MRAALLVLMLVTGAALLPNVAQAQLLSAPSALRTAAVPAPFLGGVPAGIATADAIPLSLTDALSRALEHNLGVLTSSDSVDEARGARFVALSQLLPNLSAHLVETRQKINLEVFGFPLPPGIPPVVGPFNVFDARVSFSQAVLDFGALNDKRSEEHKVAAAEHSFKNARDLVVLVTANLYLEALAAAARTDAARAQLETARTLYSQAVDLRQGGLVAGIDVLRAQVQVNAERQRVTAASNEFDKAKLQLARVIGLPVGQPFTLSDQMPSAPAPEMSLDQAVERAFKSRADYLAALERVRAAESSRAAATGSLLPSVKVVGDYGAVGLTAGTSTATYSLAGAVNVPIFQGGRVHGRLQEIDAELRSLRSQAEDLKAGIYYEVRTAFLDLEASREQLQVATEARDLAAQELVQARDRFAAGVADNIEVVQAQQTVSLSAESYISALYSYNVSKAMLARALGIAEQSVREYLGGSR